MEAMVKKMKSLNKNKNYELLIKTFKGKETNKLFVSVQKAGNKIRKGRRMIEETDYDEVPPPAPRPPMVRHTSIKVLLTSLGSIS